MHYRMEVSLGPGDVGSRVVVRWRRLAGDEVADVLGTLAALDASALAVQKDSGEVVTIPLDRVLAGKTVPPKPARAQRPQPPSER
jgi:N-acetylglutamate synthase